MTGKNYFFIKIFTSFSRLVSAFRDKLEQCHGPENCTLDNNWYTVILMEYDWIIISFRYYKQYGRKIVSQYRNRAVRKFGNEFFSEK